MNIFLPNPFSLVGADARQRLIYPSPRRGQAGIPLYVAFLGMGGSFQEGRGVGGVHVCAVTVEPHSFVGISVETPEPVFVRISTVFLVAPAEPVISVVL